MVCRSCQTENNEGARFCRACGASLALACPSCGAPHDPDQAFCDQCGTRLEAGASAAPPAVSAPELRVASVLFVDLVGYTPLSETRDVEEVRDLLSGYFDLARTIVDRYGGTVEKFIGDAVMAVWGVPVARGDDAERSVRAGLELVDAVARFGETVGVATLQARAGVATGQVAALATPGEGLVIGDRVNTASRVQAAAEPGTVFVDDATRHATAAAIAFEDAGEHAVKGKAAPLRLHRAQRVTGGVSGTQLRTGLEPPFVGRAAELRLIKDLFHASVDRGVARLVGVDGARRGRQDAARDRALALRRRARDRRPLALRPLPVIRRRGRALGARRDGPPAARDRRGRAGRRGRRPDRRRPAPLDRRPGRARAGRRGAPGAARDRRARPGARGAVRGLAAVLRAARRARPGRARVRGHALGRRRPARLPRAVAGLVGRAPDLRLLFRPARDRRAPRRLAGRGRQRDRAGARPARRRAGRRAARRDGLGAARRPARPDRRALRGHPAVRGRDGARARRPRGARQRRRGPRRLRRDRRARRAAEPAVAALGAPRRARGRRA